MSDSLAFYKPTKHYNEYQLLEYLHANHRVTQRALCDALRLSVASINHYLEDLETRGLLKRVKQSTKVVHYHLTEKGIKRKNYLKISYFKAMRGIYHASKNSVLAFLETLTGNVAKTLLIYGAGEVAELFVQIIKDQPHHAITIPAVIDDDPAKQGASMHGVPVIALESAIKYRHDGVLIGSYTNNAQMINNLKTYGYSDASIYPFFP